MLTTIAILAALLLVNALLAMSELAIMTSRQARLERSARGGSRGAGAALALSREPARFLSTVQVGITLIGIVAGAFGEQSIAQYLREWFAAIPALAPRADLLAFGSVVLVITFLSLVLGELVPKRIALAYPEQVASVIALPLKVVSVLAAPPVWVLTKASDLVLAVLRVPGKAREDVSEERGQAAGQFPLRRRGQSPHRRPRIEDWMTDREVRRPPWVSEAQRVADADGIEVVASMHTPSRHLCEGIAPQVREGAEPPCRRPSAHRPRRRRSGG